MIICNTLTNKKVLIMNEHVNYFNEEIQSKLEQLPRAIEGNSSKKELKRICREIRILKDAREYFLYNAV